MLRKLIGSIRRKSITKNNIQAKSFSSNTERGQLEKSIILNSLKTRDVRFPTSKTAEGTDSIHTNPNYSAGYLSIETNQ